MSRPSLITTAPTIGSCDRCRSMVLRGVSEGLKAVVDPVRIDLRGQVVAAMLGLEVYQLTRIGLWLVDSTRARSAHLWTVVPQHRCGLVWPHPAPPSGVVTEVDTPPY